MEPLYELNILKSTFIAARGKSTFDILFCIPITMNLKKIGSFVFGITALISCSAGAQPQTDVPLVRIGKTAAAPVIDGKLNDAAWKQSIAVNDFSVTGSKTPAAQQTQVKFVYDDQNLYISWRCEESLLVVAQQRMHEVKINAKKLDDDVLSDDSVELFLQPEPDAKMREFDVNSIGTLFDASSNRNDLWGTRDASWNSGAHAAAVQEDGYWTAELAIPWNAFGLNAPPAMNASWTLGLARHAAGRGENSSWNQNDEHSIHLMKNFGALGFDDNVPAITSATLAPFEAGKSTFTMQSSQPLEINANVTGDQKTQQFSAAGNGKIVLPLSAKTSKVLFQWNAKEGEKYFYRSPVLELSAQSSLAHLKISTAKAWKLYINGEQINAGDSAEDQIVSFPLADGINDIVMEAQSGQAKLQLEPPLFDPNEKVVWRTHAADDPKVLSETDRGSWTIAPEANNIIGTAGAPAFLQHTLLYKSTLNYPVEDPAFYITQNTAQQITFLAEGVKGIHFDDWQLSLAVPSEFDVLGSSGFYGNVIKNKPKFTTTKIGPVNINGRQMTLYHIAADNPIIFKPDSQTVLVSFEVLVRLPQSVKIGADQQWDFYYWTEGNKNAVSEAPQRIAVRALPPLNGKQPRKFVWEFWTSQARTPQYDDASLLPSILETSRAAGFNVYLSGAQKDFNDEVRHYGMKPFSLLFFSDSRLTDVVRPYLKEHPDDALIDKNGKRSDTYICTTQVLGSDWPIYEKWIEDFVRNSGLDAVDYDYEYPPFNPPHACFCDRCLEAFQQFAKIDPNVKLTPALVQKEYASQWVDFMAYRTATLLKKMKEAVHAANPKVLFTAYSGYYDAKDNTTKTRYGIDWNLVGQMQSVDEAGMGYGRPVQSIKDSIAALRGIPVKFGELLAPYDLHSRQPVAPLQRATLLRRALDATAGVLIYTRNSMDGRSWQAVADVTRLAADYENVFLNKTLQDIPGQDPASVQIAKGAGKTLLCVMNFSRSKESTFTVRVPDGLGTGKEYYSGETVQSGQTVQVELASGDAKVFVFGG